MPAIVRSLAGILAISAALLGQVALGGEIVQDTSASAQRKTDCGKYRSSSVFARARVFAIRGVSCDKARRVAKRYDHRGAQIDGWRCGLAHGGGRALFSCGKGGESGDLRDAPHALVAKGVGEASRPAGRRRPSSHGQETLGLILKTRTQEKALSTRRITARAAVEGGAKVTMKGFFRVQGAEDQFRFGPLSKQVDGNGRNFHFELSSRQEEILAFAADQCKRTPIELKARQRGARSALGTELRLPQGC